MTTVTQNRLAKLEAKKALVVKMAELDTEHAAKYQKQLAKIDAKMQKVSEREGMRGEFAAKIKEIKRTLKAEYKERLKTAVESLKVAA